MHKIATVLFSGGIDSTACMQLLKAHGYALYPVFVDFRQPAAQLEWDSVRHLSDHFECLPTRLAIESSSTFTTGEVVGRNSFLIFASLMHTPAKSGLIVIGIHAGTAYYDCSPSFFDRIAPLVSESSNGRFSLAAPLLNWTKRDVYDYFDTTGIDARCTYSCEAGLPGGCGTCLSCLDRQLL